MENLDVFIIDPDDTFRRRLSDVIEENEDLSVVDANGGETEDITTQIKEANPDVLLLGINRLNSREMMLFNLFRRKYPRLPIIVMPEHNREGGNVALNALKNGAVEYINKTRSRTGSYHTREHFAKWLVPVIKAVPRINRSVLTNGKSINEAVKEMEQMPSSYFDNTLSNMDLLTVAGCLGGIPALYQLLSTLPHNIPVPVVVVQHMPKIFSQVLAEDLQLNTPLPVQEATDGAELKPGEVYIAPGGYHARVKNKHGKKVISLFHEPTSKDYRPSIDIMFKSVQNVFKNRVLAVYLSGGGTDGIEAAKALDRAGSQIIIQNRQTALLWDLPQKIDILAVDEGMYPLDRLAHQITERMT